MGYMGQDNDGNDVDDVSLPPSPSPSSQDLIPWMPTPKSGYGKEVFMESSPANCHSVDSSQVFETDPNIGVEDQCLVFKNIKSGAYKVTVCVSIILDIEEENGWYHLVIPGLPSTSIGNIGVFCYQLSPDYGIEFRTMNFLASKIVDCHFTGDFVHRGDLAVHLRPCNSKDYGIIDDFVVNHEIKAHILVAEHDREVVERTHLCLTYHAICSPRLQGLCIWAERCSFRICIVGGPEGCFDCQLDDSRPDLQIFRLDSKGLHAIGKSYVKIICSPQRPGLFGMTWRTDLGAVIPSTLLPRIHPGISEGEGSSTLQDMISRIHITDTRTGSPNRDRGSAKPSLTTSTTSQPSKWGGQFYYYFERACIFLLSILTAPFWIFVVAIRNTTLIQLLLVLSCILNHYQMQAQDNHEVTLKEVFEGTGSWVVETLSDSKNHLRKFGGMVVATRAKHEFPDVCQHVQTQHGHTPESQVYYTQSEGSITPPSTNELGNPEVAIMDMGSQPQDETSSFNNKNRLSDPDKLVGEREYENQRQVHRNEHETEQGVLSSQTMTGAVAPSPILTSNAETVQPLSLRDKLDYMLGWKGPIAHIP